MHRKELAKANRFYKEGLRMFPGNQAYLFNIALIHFVKKEYDEAITIYKDLHKEKPESASIFMSLLLTLMMKDDLIRIVRYKDRNSLTRPRA